MNIGRWLAWIVVAVLAAVPVAVLRRGGGPRARRFLAQRGVSLGVWYLTSMTLAAVFAPLLAPYAPSHQLDIVAMIDRAPSLVHPFGTDLYSRDVLSRVIFGARVSLGIGALGMLVAVFAGTAVGAVAGYCGKWIDMLLMRLVDVGLSVPRIFVVLVAIALWGHLAVGMLIVLLGLTGWFGTSRLIRADVLVLRHAPFVDASSALGAGTRSIIWRQILPNATAPLIVSAALGVGNVMLLEAALSFLGVGVQPPTASWGNMIADGRDQLVTAPWATAFPGLAIALVVMALHTVADGVRSAIDARPTMT